MFVSVNSSCFCCTALSLSLGKNEPRIYYVLKFGFCRVADDGEGGEIQLLFGGDRG